MKEKRTMSHADVEKKRLCEKQSNEKWFKFNPVSLTMFGICLDVGIKRKIIETDVSSSLLWYFTLLHLQIKPNPISIHLSPAEQWCFCHFYRILYSFCFVESIVVYLILSSFRMQITKSLQDNLVKSHRRGNNSRDFARIKEIVVSTCVRV